MITAFSPAKDSPISSALIIEHKISYSIKIRYNVVGLVKAYEEAMSKK